MNFSIRTPETKRVHMYLLVSVKAFLNVFSIDFDRFKNMNRTAISRVNIARPLAFVAAEIKNH